MGIAAYAVLVALTLSPLLWAAVPPLVDYPNHLARMWILLQDGAIPELARNYIVDWRLLPNLAMDLVVPALGQAMPIEAAGRVFIALTMLALIGGTAALHRVLYGRVGLWPVCALMFVYNAALFWGFLNFLFGAGLFLLALSAWIGTRRWKPAPRLAVFSVAAALLLVLHMFAFGLYALAVGAYELGERVRRRELTLRGFASLCLAGVQFVPAAALWLASASGGGPGLTRYGTFAGKAYAAVSPMTFDTVPRGLDVVLVGLCVAFLGLGLVGRWLKLAPQMRLPLAALLVAAVLMPNWLNNVWAADIRIPVILPFLVIAGTRLQAPPRRLVIVFATLALTLFAARIGTVTGAWRDYDARFAELRAAATAIAPGSRLLVVWDELAVGDRRLDGVPPVLGRRLAEPFWHVGSLTVIDRSTFIPNLFVLWTPVRVAPRNDGLFRLVGLSLSPAALKASATADTTDPDAVPNPLGEPAYWHRWPETFDYVLWLDFARRPQAALPQLDLAAEGSFFRIYRIVRPQP